MVLDNNGIIQKTKDARDQYGQARENEQKELENVSDWIDDTVGVVNWDKILDEAEKNPNNYKHPDQSDENGDIGIGTDGKPVNLDLWVYSIVNTNEIHLGAAKGSCITPGYNNNNIVDGKIIGTVPQYIKIDGKDEFYPVTDFGAAFLHCDKLVIAPKIPETVKTMYNDYYNYAAFSGCTKLEVAPIIPEGVINMNYAFCNCTSLITAPTMPSSVTTMKGTFYGCTSLEKTPKMLNGVTDMYETFRNCTSLTTIQNIPSSVTRLNRTFWGCTCLTTVPAILASVTDLECAFWNCTNLTGNLIINASPTSYSCCLNNAATADDANLVVSGSSTVLDEIIATKSDNSHITKGN